MSKYPIDLTVKAHWASFSKLVFGDKKPSPIQYQEMRRAFYAGFHGNLMMMRHGIAALDEEPAVAALEALHAECQAFAKEIEEGRA
jgi:hypothetical protein